MSDEQERAQRSVERMFPAVARFLAGEQPASLPVFGPTEVQNANDDTGPAVAVVRVDFLMSREELAVAFAYGYAETNQDRPVEDMSVEDVRADVEGYLASTGYLQFSQNVADMRAGTPVAPDVQAAFAAAIDRAYPPANVANGTMPRVQAPRYGDGTVTLQTLDHGEVVVAEPAWCVGHDDELVVHRADITHNGRHVTTSAETEHGTVDILEAHLSHAPYGQLQPEPHPVVAVSIGVEDAFTVEDGRQVAHGLHVAGLRLARLVADAGRLQRGEGK